MQDAMNSFQGYTQNGQSMPCSQCGEQLSMTYSADGLSGWSQPHRCPGSPSANTIRRMIREEIEAAFKRMGFPPQPTGDV